MSNIVNKLKRNVKKITNPMQKLLGITDTTITNIRNSKYTPGFIAKPLGAVQSYGKTVIQGRNDYQPSARAIIKQYGDKKIKSIVIIRQPIQSFINTAFNALTFGQFSKKLKEMPYDKLFHLRMVATMEDGKQIQIEKNEVINITYKIDKMKSQEEAPVNINHPITLNELLDGGKSVLKDRYFSYRAFGNNCQDYQIALLKGSNLLTPQLENFIKQDVEELAQINPYLKKIANTFTDLGGKVNEIIYGTGVHKKYSKTHKVQSVVFDKDKWTKIKAKNWLKKNNYSGLEVDEKDNTLRFRQLDPDQFKNWKYYTHDLENGVKLVIAYKNSVKETNINNNNMHQIRAKGGELIHIDLNSHNASGKAKNTMEGDGIMDTFKKGTKAGLYTNKDLDNIDKVFNIPTKIYNPKGGALEIEKLKPGPNKDLTFKPTQKILKSKNVLFNNLTSEDIKDLKKLFSEVGEEETKKKENIIKYRKATIKRLKNEPKLKTTKSNLGKVRGSIEAKREAIKKRAKAKKL